MFDRDRWQEILTALKQNKLRTILTAFGVFWGIFMLIVMLGTGKGLQNGAYEGMGGFATNSMFIWTQSTTLPYKGLKKGRTYYFTTSDANALRQQVPEIKLIAPRQPVWVKTGQGENNVVRGIKTATFSINGDCPDMNRIDPVTMIAGRYINDIDIDEKRKIAVIGRRVKDEFFTPKENPIGQYLRINGVYFQIAGIFISQHNGGQAEQQEKTIEIPLTTLQRTYNYGEDIYYMAITSISNVPISSIENKVKDLLKKRHIVAPNDNDAVGSFNVEKEFIKMNGLFIGISVLVWIVGIGTLIAGVIGVSNIMLVIVKERTKEIGIQRAIGAPPSVIISQIISESIFLTSVAGYFGLVCGVGLIELISNMLAKQAASGPNNGGSMFTRPEVDFKVAVIALTILIISGALAGLVPARRAVKVKPIDALRYE